MSTVTGGVICSRTWFHSFSKNNSKDPTPDKELCLKLGICLLISTDILIFLLIDIVHSQHSTVEVGISQSVLESYGGLDPEDFHGKKGG